MGASASPGLIVSRHFEVIDERDETVGSVKHATRGQAHDLREALAGTNNIGPLAVAEVTEHLVMLREVSRI
jgi:hypothetical protein